MTRPKSGTSGEFLHRGDIFPQEDGTTKRAPNLSIPALLAQSGRPQGIEHNQRKQTMSSDFLGQYRIRVRSLLSAAAILTAVFIGAKIATSDVLMLGYTMVVPVFIFLSALIEDASVRTHRSGLLVCLEMAISAGGAAGVGYLGYRLWLLGY